MAAVHDHLDYLVSTFSTKLSSVNLNHLVISTIVLALSLPTYRFVNKDYQRFLDLGPGGTPSTFYGYLRVTYLRIFFALKDPFQPPSLAEPVYPSNSYLRHLPQRPGPRPQVEGIAPHRQTSQWAPGRLHSALHTALCSLIHLYPKALKEGVSCFEKHGFALFLSVGISCKRPDQDDRPKAFNHLNPTCRNTGEIAHLHDSDSSLHITLHPIDAALVIAAGWGERHPLAGRSVHGSCLLPAGFVMIYAPKTADDVDTIIEIVKAGAWWVGGVDLDVDLVRCRNSGSGSGNGKGNGNHGGGLGRVLL